MNAINNAVNSYTAEESEMSAPVRTPWEPGRPALRVRWDADWQVWGVMDLHHSHDIFRVAMMVGGRFSVWHIAGYALMGETVGANDVAAQVFGIMQRRGESIPACVVITPTGRRLPVLNNGLHVIHSHYAPAPGCMFEPHPDRVFRARCDYPCGECVDIPIEAQTATGAAIAAFRVMGSDRPDCVTIETDDGVEITYMTAAEYAAAA